MFSERATEILDLLSEVPVHRRKQAIARAYNIAVRDIGEAGSSKELTQALKNMKLIGDICRGHVEVASIIATIDKIRNAGPNVTINVAGPPSDPDRR